MIWLLPYFAYAAAASAGIAGLGYTAVTRLSVVQRILSSVVERTLRHYAVLDKGGKLGYTVNRTESGKLESIVL